MAFLDGSQYPFLYASAPIVFLHFCTFGPLPIDFPFYKFLDVLVLPIPRLIDVNIKHRLFSFIKPFFPPFGFSTSFYSRQTFFLDLCFLTQCMSSGLPYTNNLFPRLRVVLILLFVLFVSCVPSPIIPRAPPWFVREYDRPFCNHFA